MSYINWKVEDVSISTIDPRTLPCIEVNLTGIVNNYGAFKSRSGDELIEEIEERLNRDESWVDRMLTEETKNYIKNDIKTTKEILNSVYGLKAYRPSFEIKKVIFNNPATIIFWADGTKTVVKCQEGDTYDPEKGMAMAIAKKALGNQGNYCNVFHDWLSTCDVEPIYPNIVIDVESLTKAANKASESMKELVERLHRERTVGEV